MQTTKTPASQPQKPLLVPTTLGQSIVKYIAAAFAIFYIISGVILLFFGVCAVVGIFEILLAIIIFAFEVIPYFKLASSSNVARWCANVAAWIRVCVYSGFALFLLISLLAFCYGPLVIIDLIVCIILAGAVGLVHIQCNCSDGTTQSTVTTTAPIKLVNPGLLAGSQSQSSQSSGQRPASSVNTASVISNTGQQCNDSVESDHRCKELTNDVKNIYAAYNSAFDGYNKHVRPVARSTINVSLALMLFSIDEVDERKETITLNVWTEVMWRDGELVWDVNETNIQNIRVPASDIWLPDLMFNGILEETFNPPKGETIVSITYEGDVRVLYNQVIKVHCKYNIITFPFDTQKCIIKYAPWEHNATEIFVSPNAKNGGDLSVFETNTEWNILDYHSTTNLYHYDGQQYSEVHWILEIKRRPNYYVQVLGLPTFVITTLAIFGLFGPFASNGDREEKVRRQINVQHSQISMGLTTMLSMSLILMVVSDTMPKTSNTQPLISLYILIELLISAAATSVTILILILHRKALSGAYPPKWLTFVLFIDVQRMDDVHSVNGTITANNGHAESTDENEVSLTSKPLRPTNAQIINIFAMLSSMQDSIQIFLSRLDEVDKQAYINQLYRRICDRADILCATVFLVVNTAISAWFIMNDHQS